jgi:hyaluronan synthase/N-acetylglucosaminyltransferase
MNALIISSILGFLRSLFGSKSPLVVFITIYAILTFGYLSFKYFFSVIYSAQDYVSEKVRKKKTKSLPFVSIIIPVYNEEQKALRNCIIASCRNSYPNKEVIVIDDGSKNKESWETIEKLQKKFHFKAIRFPQNRGKRDAMTAGFKIAKGQFLITMDSDSVIVGGESIAELVFPFKDKNVGAVSGNVQVRNRNKNLLTRMQWARYWLAFNVEKASQSPYNGVTCCPGPFSAYRKEYLMRYLDLWSNQFFLGVKATYGDDRGLTTMMIQEGYKIKFAKYALCLTDVPEGFRKFTKQQIRWKKSFIRENYYLLKSAGKLNFWMKLEFFWFWIIFPIGFFIKILAFTFILLGNYRLANFGIMVLFVSSLHYTYAFIRKPGRAGYYGMLYGFLNEFWMMWLFWYGLFTLKETSWGTR